MFFVQPLLAQAAVTDITRVAAPPNPPGPDIVVTGPNQTNPLPGGATQTWQVKYAFKDLEYSIPSGGGGQKFTLPDFKNVNCNVNGANVACFFTQEQAGYFKLMNTGTIDNIRFTIPEVSTWMMMLVGFAGIAFAGYTMSGKSGRARQS